MWFLVELIPLWLVLLAQRLPSYSLWHLGSSLLSPWFSWNLAISSTSWVSQTSGVLWGVTPNISAAAAVMVPRAHPATAVQLAYLHDHHYMQILFLKFSQCTEQVAMVRLSRYPQCIHTIACSWGLGHPSAPLCSKKRNSEKNWSYVRRYWLLLVGWDFICVCGIFFLFLLYFYFLNQSGTWNLWKSLFLFLFFASLPPLS